MNRASYDAIAEQWDRQRTRLSPLEAEVLETVAGSVAPGSTILDLGCGTGRPVASFFAEAGHRIIGVDQSEGMLAFAQQRLPGQQWVLGSIEDFVPTEPVAAGFRVVQSLVLNHPDGARDKGRVALVAEAC